MTEEVARPFHILYLYAPKDERMRNELAKHLTPLKKQQIIDDWYDRDILPGTEVAQQISEKLDIADIILLLISPDFIASDCCYGADIQKAIKRYEAREVHIIPVLLDVVDWESTPFRHLQYLPKNGKAIKKWNNRSEAFAEVAKSIRVFIELLVKSHHSNLLLDNSQK